MIGVAVVFWISLSFGGPFHLRLWGAMYPAAAARARPGLRRDGPCRGGRARRVRRRPPRRPPRWAERGRDRRPGRRRVRDRPGRSARPVRPNGRRRSRPVTRSVPSASARSSRRMALAQGFFGGGLIAAAPLYALVHVDRLDLTMAQVGVIGILSAASTTVAFLVWGAVADRSRPVDGAPDRRRHRADVARRVRVRAARRRALVRRASRRAPRAPRSTSASPPS